MTDIKQRLDNLQAFLNEEGWYTKANTAYLAKEKIIELEAQIREDALQYLSDTGQLDDRVAELTQALQAVNAWIDGLEMYADPQHEPAPVFKTVKQVLKGQ